MKRKIQSFISKITVLIMLIWVSSSSLIAQTWTSADGGGINGLNNTATIKAEYPSAAVFNGELYVIWQENSQVHIKKYNGSTWTGVGNVAGQSQLNLSTSSAVDPQIVTYNGALYAAWGEFDDLLIHNIHVKKYDGSNWTFVQNYAAGDGRTKINHATNAHAIKVHLAVFNNELYATWIENAFEGIGIDQIRVSKFNGSLWTSVDGDGSYGLNYNTGQLVYKTTLCVHNNKLYVAWSENTSANISQFRVRRYDGGNTWTFVDGNGATGLNYNVTVQPTDYPLSLSSCNGKLCMFWAEGNRIRVKQYDGTSWTSGPEDASGGMNYSTTRPAESPASFAYNNLLYLAWQEHHATVGNNIRQIRVATFDGTTKTFIDGNGVAGINQQITMRAHFPKLIEYSGDLYVVWNEDNSTTSDLTPQIRLKKYPLPGISTSVTVPANGSYKTSTNLDFTVNFNKIENVVGGIPYIPITLNTGGTVNATYVSGSGTKVFLFRYTAAAGNADPDGITIGSSIALPGGCTIKDASSLDASLTLNSVGSTSAVLVDGIAPSVSSINRQSPTEATTNATSVVYRVTFSETVTGVGTSDFTLTTSGGATGGTIASVAAISGSTYDVTVNSLMGYGTFRLDLNSSSTGIADTPGNTISGGYTSGQTYTTLTPGTWTGASSTAWNLAANWAGLAVPTSTTDVTIPDVTNDPIIGATTTANCNNLTIDGTLTIQSSASGTGSLIISGTSSGTVTAERYMTGNKWHIVTPIAASGSVSTFIQASGNAIPLKNVSGTNRYGMMDYIETTNTWNNYYAATTTDIMPAGKGYSVRRASDGIVTFTGDLTSGTKLVSLSKGGTGWNCIGNPYTSAINMNDAANATYNFLKTNSYILDPSYACMYLWDDATLSYKIQGNISFGTRDLAQNVFQAGQGFFVKAASNGVVAQFTQNMQVHQTNTPFKAPAVTTSWSGIALKAASADASSSAIITFNEKMTKGLDPTYDAGLLRGTNGLSLYTRLVEDNGVDFAIQCLPENYSNLVIPVGVDCKDGGEITFSAETVELPKNCKVMIEDKTTNTFTSLAEGGTYKTTVSAGSTSAGRFYIHTSGNTTTGTAELTADINSLKAYIANEAIIIEGEIADQGIATLYNLQGLKLHVNALQKGFLNTLPCSGLMKGIYLLTIQQDGKTATKKLIKE